MWDALQQQSFLVGAALILIYQAARFGEIYAGDPVTSRYVSLLPGTGVRDFAGPHAYHWALAAFLVASLVVYSALCLISPNVLTGAVKLLTNNADADQISEGVPLPLYIAALFMGLTQPIIPGLSQFQTAQLNFFHDRIEVPRRIIDISGSLTVAIEARAGEDRQQLVAEVRKLVGNDFLTSLQPHGDLAFYKLQLEKMEVDNGSLEATNQGQLREGAPRLDRTAGALRAGCGVAQVRAEAAHQGGPEARNSVVRYQARRPPGIAGLIASGVLFFAGLFIIAELLLQLAGPVDALFGKSITEVYGPPRSTIRSRSCGRLRFRSAFACSSRFASWPRVEKRDKAIPSPNSTPMHRRSMISSISSGPTPRSCCCASSRRLRSRSA